MTSLLASGFEHAADQAADRLGRGLADCLAGQQLVDRRGQVAAVHFRLGVSAAGLKAILIVDAAGIAHDAVGIEHEHLRIAGRTQLVGQAVVQILQERKLNVRASWRIEPCR